MANKVYLDTFPDDNHWTHKCDCGENIVLYYNGGELDSWKCKCGITYEAEHVVTVIYKITP
mgnify:FL=1